MIMYPRLALACSVFAAALATDATAAVLSGSPDPVQVCDGSGLGIVTISWNANDVKAEHVDIHVGSPTGNLFASGYATGSAPTGKWTAQDTKFYLVDPAKQQVLAEYTAHVTTAGCVAAAPPKKSFWQRLFGK